jgi:hypothetical protein
MAKERANNVPSHNLARLVGTARQVDDPPREPFQGLLAQAAS